jgi:hypothetical protein
VYLTSVTHRETLFEIATRWLADRPQSGDGRRLTEIFIYEPLIAAPVAQEFLADIQRVVHGTALPLERLHSKDELRDRLARSRGLRTPRIDELLQHYAAAPEEFFPGTPADLLYGQDPGGAPAAIVRIKRIRRIAEKASRRLADCLADEIRSVARGLAARRASDAGVAVERLVSSPDAMAQDFERAERFVARAFRDHELELATDEMRIDDVLGFKFVADEAKQARLVEAIDAHPTARVVQREEHRGSYNDINLLVDLALPGPDEIVARAKDAPWENLAERGLTARELVEGFPRYAQEAARSICAEVILTTPEELIESEFGRSIHEERILDQRSRDTYRGPIAQNGSFLVEFLLALAVSPTLEVDELPVKIWGRYLPEYFSRELLRLFGIQKGPQLVGTYLPGL